MTVDVGLIVAVIALIGVILTAVLNRRTGKRANELEEEAEKGRRREALDQQINWASELALSPAAGAWPLAVRQLQVLLEHADATVDHRRRIRGALLSVLQERKLGELPPGTEVDVQAIMDERGSAEEAADE